MFGEDIGGAISREGCPTHTEEDPLIRVDVDGDATQRSYGLRPQGADPFCASLAQKLHLKRTTDLQIARTDGQSFTDSSSRVIEEEN
jgi:hypothetical protein